MQTFLRRSNIVKYTECILVKLDVMTQAQVPQYTWVLLLFVKKRCDEVEHLHFLLNKVGLIVKKKCANPFVKYRIENGTTFINICYAYTVTLFLHLLLLLALPLQNCSVFLITDSFKGLGEYLQDNLVFIAISRGMAGIISNYFSLQQITTQG